MRLARLEIEDFGLIARASLEFSDGFTVCSGETGSGKTMLLGALTFVLGERSSGDVVRSGATRARVTLAIDLDPAVRAHLEADGFETDDGSAIVAREMLPTGKSTARINGRLATSSQLRALGELVLEVVGQHEAQRLLSRPYQMDVLDAFAGEVALAHRRGVTSAYEQTGILAASLRDSTADSGRALAELEFARYASKEIEEAELVADEEKSLRERRDYLVNVEKIQAALAAAHGALTAADGAAIETLGAASASLSAVSRFAPTVAAIGESLAALQSDANDAAVAISRELDATELDAGELEATTGRLDRIDALKKKYGGSIAAVFASKARFDETIARETNRDEREAELRASLAGARQTLATEARALAALRAKAARTLERRFGEELAGLAMPAARFGVVLEPLSEIGPNGGESVEFALSPNPGEPVRPLARAASGGELSRVLLALVVVLADRREPTALVFDEIDAGIGGAAASAVGVRIGALARTSQVLCVTHLAQIASWADMHYALRKREHEGATFVELVALDDRRAILEEIARMLSGNTAAVALEHAESLVRAVGKSKTPKKQPA